MPGAPALHLRKSTAKGSGFSASLTSERASSPSHVPDSFESFTREEGRDPCVFWAPAYGEIVDACAPSVFLSWRYEIFGESNGEESGET